MTERLTRIHLWAARASVAAVAIGAAAVLSAQSASGQAMGGQMAPAGKMPQGQMGQMDHMGPMAPMAPKMGTKAPDFSLKDVSGASASLADERGKGPVVLIVGRGWPGYQCPFCTRQFAEFRSHAKELQAAGARVLWVYPGPADELAKHASDFVGMEPLPSNFRVLIDPGYTFTNAYHLRWDAPKETAYPATFVIDRAGTIRFVNVSTEHGGRTPVADVLKALDATMMK